MATTSYNQKGQHKSLSDIVELIAPQDTPFQSMIGKGSVNNTLFNWVEESLNSANADNAQVEGFDATEFSEQVLAERQNYTQIFSRTIKATGTSQAINQAGKLETLADQVNKRARELKRDMEAAFLSGQVATAGSNTTARTTASYQAQVADDNVYDMAGTVITEDAVIEMLLRLYEAGAQPDTIMCHPRLRVALTRVLSDKSGRIVDRATTRKVINSIQTYISDVGDVGIFNNVHAAWDTTTSTGDIFIFDSSMWSVEYLRNYKVEDLAKTGDSDKKMLIAEAGLKNANFNSAGIITNVGV